MFIALSVMRGKNTKKLSIHIKFYTSHAFKGCCLVTGYNFTTAFGS